MYPLHSLAAASCLLFLVAGWDIARRRVPNWLNAALIVTGLGAQAIFHGGWALLGGFAAVAITLIVLWLPWSARQLGGGDVKAVMGAAAWLGVASLFKFYLFAALAVGVAALICLLGSSAPARREVVQNLRLVWLRVGLPQVPLKGGAGRLSVPFGAAAAAAAVLLLWWR
jgi:Flp pilus assembly protein protease CpaA